MQYIIHIHMYHMVPHSTSWWCMCTCVHVCVRHMVGARVCQAHRGGMFMVTITTPAPQPAVKFWQVEHLTLRL